MKTSIHNRINYKSFRQGLSNFFLKESFQIEFELKALEHPRNGYGVYQKQYGKRHSQYKHY